VVNVPASAPEQQLHLSSPEQAEIDLRAVRSAIEAAPAGKDLIGVTRDWLEKIERELTELRLLRLKVAR
jgi:hypothetical protein